MKKCSYCGKEYPDDVERCVTDNELLLGGESSSSSGACESAASVSPSSSISESATLPPISVWTDRRLRIFEVVLVCLIAFGGSIVASAYSLFNVSHGGSGRSMLAWVVQTLREGSALGLLWYVLLRRGKSFSDLGLTWARKDVGWSIILYLAGSLASYMVYNAIYFSGLTVTSHKLATAHIGQVLFGGGIFSATILIQFLNPFFEELIVRAYVMTEIKQLTSSLIMAVIVSTVLQTSYHFYQGAPAAFSDGALFLIFSIYYAKTNRIVPIILAHLYCDAGGTLWYMFRQ
jgi:membrane protease YdiL (CAAX protease family)